MFKYLWLLPIVLFVIYWIAVCVKNIGIKNFIIDITLSLLIGFGVASTLGFIISVLINSFMSFFSTSYNDMSKIWSLITEFSLFTGCIGAVILTLVALIDAYNMSDDDEITRYL